MKTPITPKKMQEINDRLINEITENERKIQSFKEDGIILNLSDFNLPQQTK